MSETEVDYASRPSDQRFEELALLGVIERKKPNGYKGGEEVRVAVKRATATEHAEPAVDVRSYITPAADIRARRYVGPTSKGLWLSLPDAERLCELLAQAVVEGYSIIEREAAGS